ncbi:unnamed protein product [Arctia plantaginis]|uniref:Organic solute transporter alpha-like protein n=1 Tax=Arctia plantaginis TaxID=874455 RepID=A0A8S1ALB9_ARCPL|nr:unnamed protein product [Arctia plantaginis]
MDLYSEASSGTRSLTPRHISADKVLPEINNAINSTLLCHKYSNNPEFASYYSALHPYAWVLWGCGLPLLIVIWILYAISLRSAMRHWRDFVSYIAVILSVYPIVATGAFITIVLPRFRIPAEAISQQIVTVALFNFFRLLIAECGGMDEIIRRTSGLHLETRVLPCCCWPCCFIPRPMITKKSLMGLHYLVLQMPVIQAILYVIILAIWAEDFNLYSRNFLYFQPFVAASILPGIWGIVMCVRTSTLLGLNPKARFLSIQLALIIVKLQVGISKSLADLIHGPCLVNLHPVVFVSLVQNCIMLVEMCLVSIWAWRLYSVPPEKVLKNVATGKSISTVDDHLRAIEVETVKEGIDNKTFNNNVNIDD